jgi:hypothetical protein
VPHRGLAIHVRSVGGGENVMQSRRIGTDRVFWLAA